MTRAAALVVAVMVASGCGDSTSQEGRYREAADEATLAGWQRDYEAKHALVPGPPAPPPSTAEAVDFSGRYRFGPWDYPLVIEQNGDQVSFRSGGVDHQFIGGAWETVGAGVVRDGVLRGRWWCFDLSRNYANNGGCEMRFVEQDKLHVAYYHDADERIEEGYGVRAGTGRGEALHYRIRIPQPAADGALLAGSVRGRDGKVLRDAVVMVRHEEASAVRTDANGRFELRVAKLPSLLMLAAGAPGYRNGVEAILKHRLREVEFVLEPAPHTDHPDYRFTSPVPDKGEAIWNCGNCHRNSYEEWKESRHALAARNAVTRAVYERDFLPAFESGRSTVADAALCTACHAPQAALDAAPTRLPQVSGVALEGNHCDLCHKVHHTEDVGAPGVRGSLALGRPDPADESVPGPIKRVYGPLADSDYLFMGPVYHPFLTTSALCAGCHQYVTPGGLPALDTYSEWLAWSATQPVLQTCQTCHMPPGLSRERDKPAKRIAINALRRPPNQIHTHRFEGRELAAGAVVMDVDVEREQGRLVVTTRLKVRDVGHKVPTGSADKHLLLVIRAKGVDGPLALVDGTRLPDHAAGELAGAPGREFAQVLADGEGNTHVPFWRAVRVVEDTRLQPGRTVEVRHVFRAAENGVARVRAELIHRLRFKRHDVARDVTGAGARPLDEMLMARELEVN